MAQQKVVMKVLTMTDDKTRQKAMEAVTDVVGVDSITATLNDQMMTVIGEMDTANVVMKVKKRVGKVDVLSIGPA
ncbi:hypothetical protein ACP275_06G109800 [Erythranthe tilingii]